MKKYLILGCLTLSIITSCGTLGHVEFYYFNNSKDAVESNILSIIHDESIYAPPSHWNDYEIGADTSSDIYIMFDSNPKEIYQIGFAEYPGYSTSSNSCILALVGLFDGKRWWFKNDLSLNDEKRMKDRFEKEILSKMKYQYFKK